MQPIIIPPSTRLRFRLMDESDADLLWELDQDPEVMRFLNNGIPTPRSEIDEILIPRMKLFTNPARGCGLWEMAGRDSGECLGWILVREYGIGTDYHMTDVMELGWRLKRDYWGQGLTTEAARVIMTEVAKLPGITSFCAIADVDNLASIAVMKKLGMQYVDERIHKAPKGDMPVAYYDMPNFRP